MMSDRPTIECKPNGPYLVRNLEDLLDGQGGRMQLAKLVEPDIPG